MTNCDLIVGGGRDTDFETCPCEQSQSRAGFEEETGYQRVEGTHRRRQSGAQERQGESGVCTPLVTRFFCTA